MSCKYIDWCILGLTCVWIHMIAYVIFPRSVFFPFPTLPLYSSIISTLFHSNSLQWCSMLRSRKVFASFLAPVCCWWLQTKPIGDKLEGAPYESMENLISFFCFCLNKFFKIIIYNVFWVGIEFWIIEIVCQSLQGNKHKSQIHARKEK